MASTREDVDRWIETAKSKGATYNEVITINLDGSVNEEI